MVEPLIIDPKQLVRSLNQEVMAQLHRAELVSHGGESGRAREQAVRRFLRQLLPSSFGIDTGFVVDASGRVSRQVDVVVHRIGYHPIIEVGGVKHFLVESVVAAIEVKARVTGARRLEDALANIASVRALDKSGGGRNYVLVGGTHRCPDHQTDSISFNRRSSIQIFGAIIAVKSMPPRSYVQHLLRFMETHPREVWPHFYGALDRNTGVYFLKQNEGDLPEGTTTPSEYERIGMSLPGMSLSEPPLVDLAYWLIEFVRRSAIVDFQVGAYFPLSRRHADGPPVPVGPTADADPA